MLAEAQRRAVLATMGIDVYLLRARAAPAAAAAIAHADGARLVVACGRAASASPHGASLRRLLPLALGMPAACLHWIEADASGALPEVPDAPAYLALGAEMPRALGAHLSTVQQKSAAIAAADAPAHSLRDGLSRRALWQALKPLARRLREAT